MHLIVMILTTLLILFGFCPHCKKSMDYRAKYYHECGVERMTEKEDEDE